MRPARGRALADKALLLASVGVTESIDEAEQALTLARELGDPALLVRALVARGSISAYDVEVSRPYLDEAADLARELGDSWWLSQILNWQAIAALHGRRHGRDGRGQPRKRSSSPMPSVTGSSRGSAGCGSPMRGRTAVIWPGRSPRFGEVIDEAAAAHDVLLQVIGLVGESFALALQGDLRGARTTADEDVRCSSELGRVLRLSFLGGVAIACLAAGDADAAWEASEAARRRTSWQPMTTGIFVVWAAQAALGAAI